MIPSSALYTVLAQSNFYTELAQAFQDTVVFGTAPFVIYEDFEDVIRLYLPCAGEYYLGTGARLSVDTFYREFTYTVVADRRNVRSWRTVRRASAEML
jgi:hypothetical protein